jgi:MYXO-CTERM domain-containing protein
MAKPKAALKHAENMLVRHLELVAPGTKASDFTLASNVLSEGQRVVSFFQMHDGVRVLGGQVSFRFKNDRLIVIASEVIPHVHAKIPTTLVSPGTVESNARGWIASDFGAATVASSVEGPFVLPIVNKAYVSGHATVMRVSIETHSPVAKFDVFVDAMTGDVIAREQTLRFASATLKLNTPIRQPLNERADFAAPFALVGIDGVNEQTNQDGVFSFPDGASVEGTVRLNGPFVRIINDAGNAAQPTFTFAPDSTVVWNDEGTEYVDAQLNAFVHTQVAKDYAKGFAPDLPWLEAKLVATVNIDDACNAFYDGSSINFFRSNGMCENTGRISDVVFHEFGHGLHDKSIIPGSGSFDGSLSEGVGDYFSATITGDPGMGRGFFKSQQPLRHIDPEGGEKVWPDDVTGEVHADGLIIGGTLWDLRKAFIAKYGEAEGVPLTDSLFWQAMRNASDIPSMYTEILAADDDDGDLSNGTPNVCEIVEVFGAHGLRTLNVEASELSVETPEQDGYDVSITVEGLYEQCANDTIETATVHWGLQRQATDGNAITMDANGAGTEFKASIPSQLEGEVVNYRVEVVLGSGQDINYPNNEADPVYQFFVGEVVPIYCTDFEADPLTEGWSHGLIEGNAATEGADDWMWGTPRGTASNGDPYFAYSGMYVFGNDLSPMDNWNGHYQRDVRNYGASPVIDASGYKNVRLQYRRWLNVEDGYFDQASIYVNGQTAWQNFASTNVNPDEPEATVHHTDREWRFHDVDITDMRDDDGMIQVRYEIASDGGLQLGGWSVDDFCIVAYEGDLPGANCGNGVIDAGEACDDGNVVGGDGCNGLCAIEEDNDLEGEGDDGSLQVSNGCACSVPGPSNDRRGLALIALGAAVAITRRRRQ